MLGDPTELYNLGVESYDNGDGWPDDSCPVEFIQGYRDAVRWDCSDLD